MTRIAGCTALITGGASGIGLLVGKLLLEQGAGHLNLPKWFRLVRLILGLLPVRWFDRLAGEWFGIYHTMSTFRG